MGFIKRTNKKFDYKPRYYKGEGNPYEFTHKFDEFRTTVGKNKSLKGKLSSAIDEFKKTKGRSFNPTILILIALFVLIFLYIIDFDLSIFYKK